MPHLLSSAMPSVDSSGMCFLCWGIQVFRPDLSSVQLQPRVAYLILAINIGVYAAGLVAGLGPGGADAQQDYFLALAKTDAGVEAGEYYRQAFLKQQCVGVGCRRGITSCQFQPACSDRQSALPAIM